MFLQILSMILYPLKELLKLLNDSRISNYLGFSLISGIVTCVIILIVIKALVNTTYVGMGRSTFDRVNNRANKGKSDG